MGLVFCTAGGDPGPPGEPATAEPGGLLSLSSSTPAPGQVVITFTGELDLASAEHALSYVQGVIDRHQASVVLDLASLKFCDARGLGTLVRMYKYAEQAGCALRLRSPQPRVLMIMRVTGLDSELMVQPCDLIGHVAR
jgi:anti-sigma B factor antagonist